MPDEYIKRSDAIKAACDGADDWDGGSDLYRNDYIERYISKIPAADVAPVRHGYWMSARGKKSRFCSVCNADEPYKFADEDADVFGWCPHCGAKMDKKEDDDEMQN